MTKHELEADGLRHRESEDMAEGLRTHEVKRITGLSLDIIGTRRRRDVGLPEPTIRLGRERLWDREEIEQWKCSR